MKGDVQSIMGSDAASKQDSGTKKVRVKKNPKTTSFQPISNKKDVFKKPEGMARELYNLLNSGETKDIQSIMPTPIKSGYRRQKAQVSLKSYNLTTPVDWPSCCSTL